MPGYRGTRSRRRSRKKRFGIVVFSFFLMVFMFSAYKVLSNARENDKAESDYSELQALMRQEEYTDTAITTGTTDAPSDRKDGDSDAEEDPLTITEQTIMADLKQTISMDFSTLKEINPDIIGWIRAEGTNIDYPIAQTDTNEYYLTHLYNNERNSSGTIFADYRNTGDFSDRNTVIYGHHMKNKTMFHALEEYKDQEFYDVNPTMTLFTPDGDYIIELICGTVEDGNYQFAEFNFNSEEDFYEYIEGFRARSTFVSDVVIEPGDRIVSLCTCSYEWKNARYMVIGRLVPIMTQAQ